MAHEIKRGEIYYVYLQPAIGSEQNGLRPALILQNNIGNKHSPTIIVAAITSKKKAELPTHIRITDVDGLEKRSIVLLEQIKTLDKQRLGKYIGVLSEDTMRQINDALAISVGLKLQNTSHLNT